MATMTELSSNADIESNIISKDSEEYWLDFVNKGGAKPKNWNEYFGENIIKLFIEESLKHQPTEWAELRKFDLEVLKRLQIGYANNEVYNILMNKDRGAVMASPLYTDKKQKYVNCVIIKVDDEYFIAKPRNKKNLFLSGTKKPWFVKGTDDTCYITEGETDAIRLQHIYPTSSTLSLGGVGDVKHLKELRRYFNGKKVVVVFDNDAAGQEATPKAIAALSKNYPLYEEVSMMLFSKDYKDIDEYFKNGGVIDNLQIERVSQEQFDKSSKPNKGSLIQQDEDIEKILKEGVGEGKRNLTVFIVAKYFKTKFKLPYELAVDYIKNWNQKNRPPLDDNELQKVIDSVYNYKEQKVEIEQVKQHEESKPIVSTKIRLPENERLVSDFSTELGNLLKDKNMFFFKVEEKTVVEIRKLKYEETENKEDEYVGFKIVEADRFVSLIETFVVPYKTMYGTNGKFFVDSSMTKSHANLVLKSPQFEEKLPKIKRIFTAPCPILYKGELTFPKKGYDIRFQSWMPYDVVDLKPDMDINEAKKLICEIFQEFCFEAEQDVINAISALLTPFLRGLYSNFNERTPLFFYIANRERAGKDYCAGITGIVYEGVAIEEPAISTGDDSRNSNHNEELRKKIMGVLMSGRKRMHFSNNRGFINNAVLEQVITNKTHSDRVLGRNEILKFDNELDISLSGNVGVTFTPDLANRCRFIRLKLAIEDPNSRQFNKPDLHNWVLSKRSDILSSLYALVREWFNKGMPKGNLPFTSFPEWAKICGGILESNGLGSPCVIEKDTLVVGGDSETESMKRFYEFMFEKMPNKQITKHDMIGLIVENELQSEGVFHYLDFGKHEAKTRFGMLVEKYVDRILSGIILLCLDRSKQARRREYVFKQYFEKEEVGTLGNLVTLLLTSENASYVKTKSGTNGAMGAKGVKKDDFIVIKDTTSIQKNTKIITKQDILDATPDNLDISTEHYFTYFYPTNEEFILNLLDLLRKSGDLYNPKPDFWRKL